ncbi:hypothetical protein Cgig2_010414 [Carnegiea gigantea]|uniref:Squalene monooxygenase n=1 Tax=Carnegiea gigantea TaxID=171969 RepID=A0A9Q1Q5Y9_9CARY|nr:hypothetical protein Cgig2_010414 [Carnegiea gigantea]
MREKAASLPNVKLEQGTTKDGEEMKAYAPLTVVCDGCFSNLRRSLCSLMIDVPSHFVGLVLENCQLPFPNHGHVIIADPSPVLFYRISSSEIHCLVDVPGQKLPSIANGEMAKYLKTVMAPQPTLGALLMGDAFNMRHPLTGEGMTVALSDIVLLRDLLRLLKDLNNAVSLCKYLESFYTLRKPVASTINTLAGTLYKVFCASPGEAHEEMMKACFSYLRLEGEFSNGLISLLSSLNPRKVSLVVHCFSVGVYGVGRLHLELSDTRNLWLHKRQTSTL